jgi:Putative addiction module component
MASNLTLGKMSIEEKLQTMELLLDDLCNQTGAIVSPPWHEDVLAERSATLENGDDVFEDWDSAKKRIQNKIG